MRDIALGIVIFGLLPLALTRPHVGILLWTWVGLMNPHRLTWGWAYSFPFAWVIALVTVVAILLSREPKRLPMTPPVVILLALMAWMTVTTITALFPADAWVWFEKVVKIQFFIILTIIVMQSRERITALMVVAGLSVAYFGIKGGVYTIVRAGHGMVLGPEGSFIAGNTEISLALTMTLPLLRWIQTQTPYRSLRWALGIAMVLVAVAILGSYSRGGVVALAAMGIWFWLKGNKKVFIGALLLVLVPLGLALMPDAWWQRMGTIQTYEQDSSAQARINSWGFAWNLALSRPLVGGGFQSFNKDAFAIWAPDPTRVWDAHSIWFSVLGEHGFVGLALFVLLWIASWHTASRIIRDARNDPSLHWARHLAAMIQVSLIGYWAGGAFLTLAYWDYPYVLVAALVATRAFMDREARSEPTSASLAPGIGLRTHGAGALERRGGAT
jgi:probable O-glycosylation ligase (exosortase A-associated)